MIMAHLARQERPAAAVSRSLPAMIGLAGLATASTAVTLAAVSNPTSGLERNASYYLALSGVFYAGVAEVGAAVWWMATDPPGRIAAGAARKLCLYASLVPLAAATGGLAVTTLFWPGF